MPGSKRFAPTVILLSDPCVLPAALDVELGEVETRYSTAYEEKVNPFSDFRARERDQRRSKMNVLDKVMFEFGQFISGSW